MRLEADYNTKKDRFEFVCVEYGRVKGAFYVTHDFITRTDKSTFSKFWEKEYESTSSM